jgi:hypothetical protein
MKAEAIRDDKSLQSWLDARPEAVRQREAAWITYRAAARIFPLFAMQTHPQVASHERPIVDPKALPTLRSLLTLAVAVGLDKPEVILRVGSPAAISPSSSLAATVTPAFSAAVAQEVAAGNAVSAHIVVDASAEVWEAIRRDATLVSAGVDLSAWPLWQVAPSWFEIADR